MGLGGPVWHASIAYHGPRQRPLLEFTERATRQLRGVGDPALGEWAERPRHIYHRRRRLSAVEVAVTGLVMRDVRATPEADLRLDPVRHLLPIGYSE